MFVMMDGVDMDEDVVIWVVMRCLSYERVETIPTRVEIERGPWVGMVEFVGR
jgi:hypothetical protein